MGQTVVEKVAQAHMTRGPSGRPLRAGDCLSVGPRHLMTHDNSSAVIRKFHRLGATSVHDPRMPVICLDHDIQNRSEENRAKYRDIEAFARAQGVAFHPAGSGIGHQLMVEQLYALPGALVVASDSHANMYGGVGAVGTPVVRSDAAVLWATGECWWRIPASVQVVLEGKLRDGSQGKDAILALCGLYTHGEVANHAVEFAGEGIATLGIAERLAIANMTTEWGAVSGWFPADAATFEYLHARSAILASRGITRIRAHDLRRLELEPTRADADAVYAARITLDLASVAPHVAGPDTIDLATPLPEIEARRIRIHKAFLVSCVNSRFEDLNAAAAVLRGARVAEGVALYVAAASLDAQREAEANGAWKILADAGATFLPPGCGPCIGLGEGVLASGEVGISASNRNFVGRMGARDARCYLANPEVVAASAVAGYIRGPRPVSGARLAPRIEQLVPPPAPSGVAALLPGFPERVLGRLVCALQDNLNTDGIYGREHTYRDDLPPERMAEVVMHNYDPSFATLCKAGDVLAGGFNFGTGSSREQAATALQAKGIALILAGSFAQSFLRNAFNNGLICVDAAEFVRYLRTLVPRAASGARRTWAPGDEVAVEFLSSTIRFRDETFRFPALGEVAQALVTAGGLEREVRRRFAPAASAAVSDPA